MTSPEYWESRMAVPVGETSKQTALSWGTAQARLPRRPQEPTAKSSLFQTVFQHGPPPPPSQAGSPTQTVLLRSTGCSPRTPPPQAWASTPPLPLVQEGRQQDSPFQAGRRPLAMRTLRGMWASKTKPHHTHSTSQDSSTPTSTPATSRRGTQYSMLPPPTLRWRSVPQPPLPGCRQPPRSSTPLQSAKERSRQRRQRA